MVEFDSPDEHYAGRREASGLGANRIADDNRLATLPRSLAQDFANFLLPHVPPRYSAWPSAAWLPNAHQPGIPYGTIMPARIAQRTADTVESTDSFCRIRPRWQAAVLKVTPRLFAMAFVVKPSAIKCSTSNSLLVSMGLLSCDPMCGWPGNTIPSDPFASVSIAMPSRQETDSLARSYFRNCH
jgi:hypothetical protein